MGKGAAGMTDIAIPQPLDKEAILALLYAGACIQRDRHGAAVIQIHGRCADDWEELKIDGWLTMSTSGNFVLNDKGRAAYARGLERG